MFLCLYFLNTHIDTYFEKDIAYKHDTNIHRQFDQTNYIVCNSGENKYYKITTYLDNYI